MILGGWLALHGDFCRTNRPTQPREPEDGGRVGFGDGPLISGPDEAGFPFPPPHLTTSKSTQV